MKRRELLSLLGRTAGIATMYQAMTALQFAEASPRRQARIALNDRCTGTSVLILGAGLAGLVAGLELQRAGYRVRILEYNNRPGGRSWTLRGGDVYRELGGKTQHCDFADGQYLNPGPWRIPYHHHTLLGYCKELKVALEPVLHTNPNAFVHSASAFGGERKRIRHVAADFNGYLAEMLAKAIDAERLDGLISAEDVEILRDTLPLWGGLDADSSYKKGYRSSERRGWKSPPGGGLEGRPVPSTPTHRSELLSSRLWQFLGETSLYDFHPVMFQPAGGMDRIANAFGSKLDSHIQYRSKVTSIDQTESKVIVTYTDLASANEIRIEEADYCLCTIPLSVLSQIDIAVGNRMADAIRSLSAYISATKIGLQFSRRFWEQDDAIFGGSSYTDLPISQIAYPCYDYHDDGKGVLLGAYTYGTNALKFAGMSPDKRILEALRYGLRIHPQMPGEFENGISVAWHRVPWSFGCFCNWTEELRSKHYADLCAIDGRILLAGEHASHLPGWQEGAVLSAIDAIERLHRTVVS